MMDPLKSIYFNWLGPELLVFAWPIGVQLVFFSTPEQVSYLAPRDLDRRVAYTICESSLLIHHGGYYDLLVCP